MADSPLSKNEVEIRVVKRRYSLVDLLLLVDGELTWAHVDQQEKTTTTTLISITHAKRQLEKLTQLTGSGRSRTSQSPCAGGVGAESTSC